jgi:hypothetical protein
MEKLKELFSLFRLVILKPRIIKDVLLEVSNRTYIISKTELYQVNSSVKETPFKLDPHEIKFIYYLIQNEKIGLSVFTVNKMFYLNKLSKVNQRQRRHSIIKELNFKLFLITNIRESIVRVASEEDKRVKFYYLLDEVKSNKKLFNLTENIKL